MRKLLLVLTAFLFFAGQVFAQKTITGKVTDDKGAPLANVSVTVKGTSTGTVTKADGTYSLTVPANARQLEFSYVGLASQTVNISGSKTDYSLSMAAAASSDLDEVVVTGISRVKKSQFAGAANKIDGKDIINKPVGSLDQLLQGRAPGVLALTTSGQPGNNSVVIIRGTNSVVGGSTPLYVVDGIPVEASVFQGYNPNDFASIDILRDAASLAQYGSRGSAGVIVVTTKRGQSGKMQLSYSGQYGIKSRPDFAFRPMNTAELLKAQEDYGKIVGGASNNSTAIPGWYYSKSNPRYIALTPAQQAQADYLLDSISKIDVNWSDYFFRQGNFSNHEVNLSGGTGKTRLFTSVALYNEEGTTTRTDMKRATVRNNVDYADDKLTFSLSSTFAYVKRNFQQSTTTNGTANPFLAVNIQQPFALVYKPDGSYATGVGAKYVGANQLDLTKYDMNYNDQFKGTLGINIGYKIARDFTLGFVAGVDFRETQGSNYQSREAFLRTPAGTTSITALAGSQIETMERNLTTNVRPSLTYRKLINEKHDLEVTALGEYVQENYKFFNLQGYGIDPRTPNTPAVIQPGNATNQLYILAGGNKDRSALASGLGLLRYTFDGKYTLTGSFRSDGSSKLPEESRWVNFWSLGGIWEASKEDFMKNVDFINSLRLRASYGSSGNANNFPRNNLYLATYGSGSYSGLPTQVATYPGVPDAKWEITWVTNIGLDFEMFKRRLYGDLNWYDKRTKNLFLRKQLSAEAGGFTLDINAGELQNTGFEWNINYEVLRKRDLVWTLFTTGGYNKNELLDIGGQQPFEQGTSFIDVGLPLGTHYTVRWGGVDAATGQPLYYTKDGQLTTTYNASNNVSDFGTWEAPWKGGFGTSLRYKGFNLNVLFSWQEGAYKMDNLEYFVENPVGFLSGGYNQSSDLKFWQKPGDIVSTPSPLYGTNFSSKLIHNASFVRVRDVTLGYNVPKAVTDKIKFVSNINIYVQGTNLFMWTKWRGMDPEAGPVNINLSEFPNPRAFTGGVTVTF